MCADQSLTEARRMNGDAVAQEVVCDDDPLLDEAKAALPDGEEFPVSFLQRRFRLGYSRACKIYRALQTTSL